MANRKRPIVLRCPVTAEERALIEQKMAQLPTQRIGAYLRKMAIDGYIIYTDTADIKALTAELSAIGRNINQIAKKLNAGGPAYQADMDEIRERLDQIPLARKTVVILRLQSRIYHSFIMFKKGANSLLSRLSLSTPLVMATNRTPFSLNITSV